MPLLARICCLFTFLTLVGVATASGQVTVAIARVAFKEDVTQRFAEVLHESKGGWIFPDVGYVDFGGDLYREFFAGAEVLLNLMLELAEA